MNTIINFFDSNFFVGLVTLLAGAVAFFLYWKQKNDLKKDAANIVLLEIQNAERILGQVGENVRAGTLPNKFLLPNDSWSKYKYLFVRYFDRDEWDIITEFYNNCKLYDEAVTYNGSLFQKNEEQIRVNMLRVPAGYIKDYVDGVRAEDEPGERVRLEEFFTKSTLFQNTYLSRASLFLYNPQKPLNDARVAFDNINSSISQASIGSKLKKLAGLKA
ncbi:MAG: hypothetical protein WC719_02975 [Patescibacteria group bacterium]|jgi:hypothetical protein